MIKKINILEIIQLMNKAADALAYPESVTWEIRDHLSEELCIYASLMEEVTQQDLEYEV